MKLPQLHILLLLSLLTSYTAHSQSNYPKNDFISPVEFPILLSGTFAELRPNHFHSGIDIKTQGVEGKRILACADGYVSRIRVSPGGYGKAIYITHSNGYSTVYGHLSAFNNEIGTWVKAEQYRREQFDVDLYPQEGQLRVKQGEVIAYSGNSGSSGGPHLHFEVRETKTESPVNPLLFGFEAKDYTRPTLNALRLYPEGKNSLINRKPQAFTPEIAGWGVNYRLAKGDTIEVSGGVSFGINAHDLLNGSINKNGISRITITGADKVIFEWKAEIFSFSESRYINSLIDYASYHSSHQRFIRSKVDPNNKLSLYKKVLNNGVLFVEEGTIHPVKIEIADGTENTSAISFVIKGGKAALPAEKPAVNGQIFSHKQLNKFSTPHLKISLPGNCLYDSIVFEYHSTGGSKTTCASVHHIHHASTPLHDYYDLSLRVDSVWLKKQDKLVVVSLSSSGKPSSQGGKFENGFLNARVREFGRFTVMADTTAPAIKPVNISNNKDVKAQKSIRVTISDNLSGIKSYRGSLNGKWILMDYDAKNSLLVYDFDERMLKGNNDFELEVTDGVGNKSVYRAKLIN